MADYDSVKVVTKQEIINIPEHIEYPVIRVQLDGIEKGDKIILSVSIKDKDNNIKFDETHKLILKEYPDVNKVVGRVALNLNETIREIIPEPIK